MQLLEWTAHQHGPVILRRNQKAINQVVTTDSMIPRLLFWVDGEVFSSGL